MRKLAPVVCALLLSGCGLSLAVPQATVSPAPDTPTSAPAAPSGTHPATRHHPTPTPRPTPTPTNSPTTGNAMSWPIPIDQYTPGAVTPGCTYPRPTSQRAVTQATKAKVSAEYGFTPTSLADGEYDHRIPFALCGDNGPANLWPEPYDGAKQSTYTWNHKDALEAYAASQVRNHHWTLTYAQNVFKGDWRASWCAYRVHYASAGIACP
jgi:hypothetical protein